ncbi:MAG: LysE family transporter [Spirochaetes bacterium]|nr:LysE family transporter [Spirochaetota bacterium]
MTALVLIFAGSFVAAFSGALMPGPLLFYTIAKSARHGAATGFLVILGHAILELLTVTLLLFGIHAFLNRAAFETAMSLIGGALLLGMGVLMILPSLRNRVDLSVDERSLPAGSSRNLVVSGFIVSLSNPYFLMWWLFIGAGYLFAALKSGFPGVVCFFAGHIIADMAWYTFVSYGVHKGRRFISPFLYRALIVSCGVLIMAMGLYFLYHGLDLSG